MQPPTNPSSEVTVAVLNWNGLNQLKDCLPSVRAQTQAAREIVVIDNGSTDGSIEYVQTCFPEAVLIRNEKNRGFCGGGNQAVANATGKYVLLLNNDVVLHPDCLQGLNEGWNAASPDVLALFPKVLSFQAKDRIDTFGARWDPWRLWTDIGRGEQADRFTSADRTFGAYFVAPCFRKEAFTAIGGFDEAFFFQAEDFDVCYRANVLGYRLMRCPGAVLYHKQHGSRKDNKVNELLFISRFGVRNLLMVVLKNYEGKNVLIYFPWILFSKWARSIVGSVLRHGVSALFTAIFVHLKMLAEIAHLAPHILERRRDIQARRVLTDAKIWEL